MYSGSTLFMRLLSLSARKRLVLVLVVSVVSMGLPELFGLTFPISYFGSALALV